MRCLLIILVVFLAACSNKTSDEPQRVENETQAEYSEAFSHNFQNGPVLLRADSLLFPLENDTEVVLTSTILELDREYLFTDKAGRELKLTRTSYTDIQFEVGNASGTATLQPTFYLGAETLSVPEGEYWITHYYVSQSTETCFDFIAIGNQNLLDDQPTEVYAYISLAADCPKESGVLIGELLFKKK